MKKKLIAQTLQQNAGNRLTPELISGIAARIYSIIDEGAPTKEPEEKSNQTAR